MRQKWPQHNHLNYISYIYIYISQHISPTSQFRRLFFSPHVLTGKLPNPIHFLLISFVSFFFSSCLSFIFSLSLRHENQCSSIIQLQQGACHSPAILFSRHYNIYLLPQVFTSLILPYLTFFPFCPRLEYLFFVSSGRLCSLSSCGLLLSSSIHYLIIFSLHFMCCYGYTSTTGQNAPFSSAFLAPLLLPLSFCCLYLFLTHPHAPVTLLFHRPDSHFKSKL